MRQCGECTKCCEGWLKGDVKEHSMYPGKPCFFLQIGIGEPTGCSDYENRPDNPCKSYNCLWILDQDIPDEFKPEKTGVILDIVDINGFNVLRIVPAPDDPSLEMLLWILQYSYLHGGLNMVWSFKDNDNIFGSTEFVEMMTNG
jgi:hypothetical protein